MPSKFDQAYMGDPRDLDIPALDTTVEVKEPNPFDIAAMSESKVPPNPFDELAKSEKQNAPKAQPTTSPSVGTAVPEPSSTPAVPNLGRIAPSGPNPFEAERVKEVLAAMPQFRETFFGGAEEVKEPAAKTYATGEYGKKMTDRIVGTAKLATYPFRQNEEDEKAAAMKGLIADMNLRKVMSDPAATREDKQKAKMQRELINTQGRVMQTAPAQFLDSTVGNAMRGVQENITRPAGVMAFKSAMLPLPKMLQQGPAGAQAWASLTPEQQEVEYVSELTEEQREFYFRTKGAPAAKDIKPGKYVVPGAKEYYMREFLRATATDKMALTGKSREAAEGALPELNVGGFNITPLFAHAAELGGELPYYALLPTGVAARTEAKIMAGAEKEGIALGGKAMAKQMAAARTEGMAREFAVQSAAVGIKNKEDPVSSAVEGYVAGHVLGKFHELITGNRAAKKAIMSAVNTERASYGTSADGSLILPPITWKEYIKQPKVETATPSVSPLLASKLKGAELKAKQAGENEAALSKVTEGTKYSVPVSTTKPQLGPEPTFGSRTAPHTFKTIERGRSGELRAVHYQDNIKTGRKKVYSEPLKQSHFDEYSKVGSPEATDGDAYTEFLNLFTPSKQTLRQGWGKEGYKSPEEAAALIDSGMVKPPPTKPAEVVKFGETPKPPSRDDIGTAVASPEAQERLIARARAESPKVLTVDAKGNVSATSLIDRTPEQNLVSPKHVRVGDIVHLPDEQLAVVDKLTEDGVIVSLRNDLKMQLGKAEVTLAAEDLVDLQHAFGPVASGRAIKNPTNNLLRFKELDIKRVMNAAGIENPAEAKALLDSMVMDGKLHPQVDGVYEVRASYKPEAPDGALKETGYRYYYAVTPDGQGLSGVVRGRDPNKIGNVLIEVGTETGAFTPEHVARGQKHGLAPEEHFTKTKTISVPRNELRSYVPVLPNANKSPLPNRLGITVPMPPDVLMTNEAAVKAMADLTRMDGQMGKLLIDKKSVGKALQRLFNHDAWMVPTDIRQKATTLAAQPGTVKGQTELYQSALSKRLGGEISPADTEVARIMKLRATKAGRAMSEQEKELVKFFAANPHIEAEAQQTIKVGLARLKDLQRELAKRGVGNIADLESARMLGLEDEYATNVYMKYLTSRTKWADFVHKQLPDVWNKAYEHIVKLHPNEDWQNAESRMQEYLGVDTDTLAKQIRAEPNGAVAKKLRERLKLATAVQNLIGKIDSASVQMAHSLATSESILRRIQVWDDVAATPYWSPGPRADLGPEGGIQVPDSPIYGRARNGRVHESMRFLLEAKKPQAESSGILKTLTSIWKFNQVIGGGATPWINQIMRNWKGLIVSGGLQSLDDLHTVQDAVSMMLKYHQNPILAKGTFYDALLQNGGIGTGFAGSEINKNKAANRILQEMRKQKGATSYWELMDKITGSISGSAEEAGAMYDAIDRAFKLTAAMNNYRRAISKGMSPDDAMALTVMRNNQSFVNFEMVSPATEKMRQSGVSAVAPFVSSKMEDLRINGTILMRLKDEPDLAARLAVATGSVAGAMALMREQRRANGISDDMARKALDKRTLTTQAYKPMSAVLPGLDSQGRMQVADVTPWEDLFMLLQMHERDNPAVAILRNNLTGVFGDENLIGQGINMMANVATGAVPLSAVPQMVSRPGEQGMAEALAFIAANGGLPNAPFKGYKTYMSTQPPTTGYERMFKEPMTEAQGAAKMWGVPIDTPIGSHTGKARAKETLRNMHELDRQIHGTVMGKERDKARELIDAKIKAKKEIIHEYQDSKK